MLSLDHVPDDGRAGVPAARRPVALRRRARSGRRRSRDTKILAAWNGLMISAFARAGLAFAREDYVRKPRAPRTRCCARTSPRGGLLRTGTAPRACSRITPFSPPGWSISTRRPERRAGSTSRASCTDALAQRFAHPDGGFFRTADDHEALLAREKPAYDGAEPTGNSVAALTLLRLEALTGELRFREQAEKLLRSAGALLAGAAGRARARCCSRSTSCSRVPREVVLVRPAAGSDRELLDAIRGRFEPSQVLIRHREGAPPATPLARDRPARSGKARGLRLRPGRLPAPGHRAAEPRRTARIAPPRPLPHPRRMLFEPLQLRDLYAAQPDRRLAHVPVLERGRVRERLALRPPRLPRRRRSGAGVHRGERR